eukprot:3459859-Rhodomonas_salina.1
MAAAMITQTHLPHTASRIWKIHGSDGEMQRSPSSTEETNSSGGHPGHPEATMSMLKGLRSIRWDPPGKSTLVRLLPLNVTGVRRVDRPAVHQINWMVLIQGWTKDTQTAESGNVFDAALQN